MAARNRETGDQRRAERFGPRRSKAHTGVPADHFVEAPKVKRGKVKRSIRAIRAEQQRRRN